ncbi:succinyl-diaminopimelate desuccinylase [Candidatus Albibeggiatoa sp. nov. NOAA]|uniref:succinyl-diaminopimelate desuccinylase n=1 Tax=Candidatus Albibeggiatoa sp. nov. NOAA TaxID=3162724 RepID=UPI0032F95C4D|nr:succinyl-diaminopimelate desuccinylase [Thiotrichaceae bacterium]
MSECLDLAIELIKRPSITPKDEQCQPYIAQRLEKLDFKAENLRFGEVDNLWLRRGTDAPLFVFAGHTDVVPTGDESRWQFPPFEPTQHEGYLYGRGAADMKGNIAAFIVACERFVAKNPHHKGSIAYLLTSDEEGPAIDGTVKVIEHLQAQQTHIDWCLVGEPSSSNKVADTVKNGRRGSLGAHLLVKGVQGHVAYPHLADNPIHRFAPVLHELSQIRWDEGNSFFPPTSFQVSNIQAGTGATNMIPGELAVKFNFRYSTELKHTDIQQTVLDLLAKHNVDYEIKWEHSGKPFLTAKGELVEAAQAAVQSVCGYETELSTSGGTSDGRFIAPTGAQVIELGVLNDTIHKLNERICIADLDVLADVYENILQRLLGE